MPTFDASDLDYYTNMRALAAPPPPPEQSLPSRIWSHLYNLPKNASEATGEMLAGIGDTITGKPDILREADQQARQQGADQNFLYQSRYVAPAKTFGEKVTDVVGAGVLPSLPALMIPGGAIEGAAGELGASAGMAKLAGNVGTGALSGLSESPSQAAVQGGEFALMDAASAFLPKTAGRLLRASVEGGTGAGVSMLDQASRGNNPFTEQGLIQAGTMGAFPFAMEGAKRLMEKAPPETGLQPNGLPPAPPAVGSQGGVPADWKLRSVTQDDEGTYHHVFDTPQGPQTIPSDIKLGEAPGEQAPSTPVTPQPFDPEAPPPGYVATRGLPTPRPGRPMLGYRDPFASTEPVLPPTPEPSRVIPSRQQTFGTEENPLYLDEPPAPKVEPTTTPPVVSEPKPFVDSTLRDAVNNRSVVNYQGEKGKLLTGDDGVYFRKLRSNEQQRVFGLLPDAKLSDVQGLSMERQGQQRGLPPEPPVEQPGPYNTQITPQTGESSRLARPKFGESGSISGKLLARLGLGATGAAVGYATGDDEQSKIERALLFGAAGAALPGLASKLGGRFGEKYLRVGQSDALDTAKEQSRGTASSYRQRVAEDLKAAIPGLRTLTPAQKDAAKIYLSSDRGVGAQALLATHALPPEVNHFLLNTTKHKAELQGIIAEAQSDPEKKALIQSTLGTYVTEPYKAFTNNKEWRSPEWRAANSHEALIDQIVSENQKLPQYAGQSPDLIRKDVEDWVRELGTFNGDFDRFQNEGGSSMSKSLFTARKDLRPSVKKLLGRIEDPIEREVLTVQKLTKNAQTAKLVTELLKPHAVDDAGRKLVMTRAEWDTQLQTARAAGKTEEVKALEDNYEKVPDTLPGLGRLSQEPGGMMAQRQVKDALQIGDEHKIVKWDNVIMDMLTKIPKAAHTVLNPGTHVHNIVQAPFQALAAGILPWELVNRNRKLASDPKLYRMAQEDGALDAHMGASELSRASDGLEHVLTPGVWQKTGGKLFDAVKGLYGKPDQWVRGAAWLKFLEEGQKKGMPLPEARRYAVENMNRYTQNYANVAPAVGLLRKLPLVNPFISYSAEIGRVIKNLAQDVVSNKNGRRFQSGAALATFLGLGSGVAALINNRSRMTDEDKQKLQELIPLLPPYMHGRTQVQAGRDPKTGTTNLFNLNPWLPAEDFIQTAKNIAHGDWDAVEKTNPIAGLDRTPILNVIQELNTGKDSVTGQPTSLTQSLRQNFLPGWVPGNYSAEKLNKGFTRNEEGTLGITDSSGRKETPASAIGALFGVSVAQENPRMLMMRQKQDRQDALDQAQSNLRRVLRTDANEGVKKAAEEKYIEARRLLFQKG